MFLINHKKEAEIPYVLLCSLSITLSSLSFESNIFFRPKQLSPKINRDKHVLKADEIVLVQAISALIYLFIVDMIQW